MKEGNGLPALNDAKAASFWLPNISMSATCLRSTSYHVTLQAAWYRGCGSWTLRAVDTTGLEAPNDSLLTTLTAWNQQGTVCGKRNGDWAGTYYEVMKTSDISQLSIRITPRCSTHTSSHATSPLLQIILHRVVHRNYERAVG